jgi:hypothetical protein
MYFAINGTDFSDLVSTLKIGYETLVSSDSGRNAAGNTIIDIVNKKIKVYTGLKYTTQSEMKRFLSAINDYVVQVSFRDPKSGNMKTITAYTGTPEPEYYTIQDGYVLCKPMDLNFIEL